MNLILVGILIVSVLQQIALFRWMCNMQKWQSAQDKQLLLLLDAQIDSLQGELAK